MTFQPGIYPCVDCGKEIYRHHHKRVRCDLCRVKNEKKIKQKHDIQHRQWYKFDADKDEFINKHAMKTLVEVAKTMQITRERARQIETSAINKLRMNAEWVATTCGIVKD